MDETLIDGRYQLVRELGRGAQGATHLAIDPDGREVALKELDFAGVGSWDSVSVFEREAAVLGGLTHHNIPRIVESFSLEADDSLRLFLVQEYVDGQDLRQRLEAGEVFDERRLRRTARDVLGILAYLHGYSPPVLHRDVKPANLIERDDGSIALVDFGAAQGSSRSEAVIGTTGYMPAEQLMGRASARSDLYALGATLIHLATRKHPAQLGHGLGLQWRRYANVSEKFADFIDRLVAPVAEDRFPTALAAKRELERERPQVRPREMVVSREEMLQALEPNKPERSASGSHTIMRSSGRLEVIFHEKTPVLLTRGIAVITTVGVIGFAVTLREPAFLLYLFIAPVAWFAGRLRRGVTHFTAHDRGLDVVSRRTEIARRLPLHKISGPDVLGEAGRWVLVVWMQDGKKIELHASGERDEIESLCQLLRDWLTRVRRQEER